MAKIKVNTVEALKQSMLINGFLQTSDEIYEWEDGVIVVRLMEKSTSPIVYISVHKSNIPLRHNNRIYRLDSAGIRKANHLFLLLINTIEGREQ